ncbi:hypothetical protein ACFLS4_03815 [Bacteroidota bacterium]
MANQNFRAHYNINGKTAHIDFSISKASVTEETKQATAHELIKKKHPEFNSKNIIISKLNVK